MRTLILALSTLAMVGVLFAVYQIVSPPSGLAGGPAPQSAAPTSRAASDKSLKIRPGVGLQPGRRVVIRDHNPHTGQGRFVLEVAAWEPVDNTRDEFDLEAPRIGLRSPGGQAIEITADHGRLELRRGDRDRLDPRRGRLWGSVRITVDRLSDAERQALTAEQRSAPPREERLVRMETEEVDFDIEYARVESKGALRVHAAEAEIEISGLTLRYNELDNSIEHLEIPCGGTIALAGHGGIFRVGLPGSSRPDASATPAAAPPLESPSPPPASQPQLAADGIPLFEPDEPKTAKARPAVTYKAVFRDAVQIEQRTGAEATARLTADVLELLFDFGQAQRQAASRGQLAGKPVETPADGADAVAAQDSATSRPGQPAFGASNERMVVTWTGPLVLDLLPESADPEVFARGRRLHATATGAPVRVWERQGEAICGKLEFHDESDQVALYPGAGAEVVTIRSEENGQLEGREAHFDGQAKTAYVLGPGHLRDTRRVVDLLAAPEAKARGGRITSTAREGADSPQPSSGPTLDARAGIGTGSKPASAEDAGFDIRFAERMDIELASTILDVVDPATGAAVEGKRDYLKRATFTGAVAVRQGADALTAGQVEVSFAAPPSQAPAGEKVERLVARDQVDLRHADEQITCDDLDVAMTADSAGRPLPQRALAHGNVVAQQGHRRISAGDKLVVDITRVEHPLPPFDLTHARAIAVQRGIDPDTVDWDAQRAKYEKRTDYTLALGRVQASGQVMITDPDQSLEIIGESLDCRLADGQRVESALVTGADGGPATVHMQDFAITGRTVELDATRPYAHVPGGGRLEFVSQQDLDGRQLDKPTPVIVTWSREMTFRAVGTSGGDSSATFSGDVHAVTESSSFDSDELAIEFVDAAPQSQPAADALAAARSRSDWWIFTPLASRFESRPAQRSPADVWRLSGSTVRRDPVYVRASGGAIALTTNVNPRSGDVNTRGRIAGQRMAIDLRLKVMKIDGAGDLLLEDYQIPPGKSESAEPRRTPFGNLGAEGPSQTYLSWAGSMSFDFGHQAAQFERDVSMIHRSGTQLMLGDKILHVDPAQAKAYAKGRDARLSADQLLVSFTRSDAPHGAGGAGGAARSEGIGRMSGNELKQFQAEGHVYFEDSGITANAHQISYNRQQDLIWIAGPPGEDAEVTVVQAGAFKSIKSPEFRWEPSTKRLEAPKSRLVGH